MRASTSSALRLTALRIVAVLWVALAGPACAATPLPAQWTHLVSSFDARLGEDHMVGGSIALVQDGRIIAHHEYGYADQAGGRKVDPGTLFHWASNTKTLNAISIMQLRDRGLLRLQDPVTRYVPELRQVHNPFGSMAYGSFVKVLEDYVGPPPKMTLEQAVYKMSGLTAHVVGIHDRGELVRGKKGRHPGVLSGGPA